MVAWSHWARPYQFGLPFGAGVHLFYVLSGFLITGILLRLRAAPSRRLALRAFYVRRALRILPAFYLTVAAAAIAAVPLVRESWGWHAAHLSNVWIYARGEWPEAISHFWSLAVEEQFYLVWPALIVFAPARWLAPIVAIAIASAPLFRGSLAGLGARESFLALLTPGCMDSLGVGAMLALVGERALEARHRLLVVGLATWLPLVACDIAGMPLAVGLLAVKQTCQALVFGALVLYGVRGFGGPLGRVLASAPVLYVGRISYGIYLVHGFAGELALGLLRRAGLSAPPPEPWRLLLLAGVTLAVASLSWALIESPLNGLKARYRYD